MYSHGAGAREDSPGAPLAAHVAQCAACRRIQENLAAALSTWRTQTSLASVPDAEREWHAVRRRIRQGTDATSHPHRRWLALVTWPLAAAAAAAVLFVSLPRPDSRGVASGEPSVRADFVEAPGRNASTMVIVDDKSGWLIVWASDASPREG